MLQEVGELVRVRGPSSTALTAGWASAKPIASPISDTPAPSATAVSRSTASNFASRQPLSRSK